MILNFEVKDKGSLHHIAGQSGDIIKLSINGKLVHEKELDKAQVITCWAYVEGPGFVGYLLGGLEFAKQIGL